MKRRLPRLSGHEVIEILTHKFGFRITRRRGNHVVLTKIEEGKKQSNSSPLHPELKPRTLLGILELAGISREEFLKACKEN